MARERLRQVLRIIIGHAHFKNHSQKGGLFTDNPQCRICGLTKENKRKTNKHIVQDCMRHWNVQSMFQIFETSQLESFDNPSIGNKIVNVVKCTGYKASVYGSYKEPLADVILGPLLA